MGMTDDQTPIPEETPSIHPQQHPKPKFLKQTALRRVLIKVGGWEVLRMPILFHVEHSFNTFDAYHP